MGVDGKKRGFSAVGSFGKGGHRPAWIWLGLAYLFVSCALFREDDSGCGIRKNRPATLVQVDMKSVSEAWLTGDSLIVTGRKRHAYHTAAYSLRGDTLKWADTLPAPMESPGYRTWSEGRALETDGRGDLLVGLVKTRDWNRDAILLRWLNIRSGGLIRQREVTSGGVDYLYGLDLSANGTVYFSGETDGNFEDISGADPPDGFLGTGEDIFQVKQYGGPGWDSLRRVKATSGAVFAAGQTGAVGAAGTTNVDLLVVKTEPNGNTLWQKEFGTTAFDIVHDIRVTEDNGLLITGETEGAWPGQTNQGGTDAFVVKMDPAGNLLWSRQWGSAGWDSAQSLIFSENSNPERFLVIGQTNETLATVKAPEEEDPPHHEWGAHQGGLDVFISSFRLADGKRGFIKQVGTDGDDFYYGGFRDAGGGKFRFPIFSNSDGGSSPIPVGYRALFPVVRLE